MPSQVSVDWRFMSSLEWSSDSAIHLEQDRNGSGERMFKFAPNT